MKRIIYARGFPYGAPMVWLRGGGTKDPEVKEFLKYESEHNWWWNSARHGWESAMYADELKLVLISLRDMGYEVVPKADMDPDYVIDLGSHNLLSHNLLQ